MTRTLLLGLCLSLAACAARTPLPVQPPELEAELPLTLHIAREQGGEQRDWLLVIQREAQGLRWSLFDPLGMPLARKRLEDGAWRNDGLLPPNAEAGELFSALLFALTPTPRLADAYPPGSWQRPAADAWHLAPDWRIEHPGPLQFNLHSPPDLNYRVVALPVDGDD